MLPQLIRSLCYWLLPEEWPRETGLLERENGRDGSQWPFSGLTLMAKRSASPGLGRIGSNLARKAKGFDMKIIYSDIRRNKELEQQIAARYVDKETLLKESDFLSLHLSLSPETRHYISEKELKLMKKTAVLINASRGPVVDEKALVKALQEKQIWGAGLDTFENEPQIEPELMTLDNVVMVPHIASATNKTRLNMGAICCNNIIKVLNGQRQNTGRKPEVLNSARTHS